MTAHHSTAATVLVAIDISKHRHEVLIGIPGKKRRHRMTITNMLEDFQRLAIALASYELPVRIGFEGQTMGLAAIITVPWLIISARPVST